MVQVIEMTDEEKYEMYMKIPHEELVKMKIEEEKSMKMMEDQYGNLPYINKNPNCKNTCQSNQTSQVSSDLDNCYYFKNDDYMFDKKVVCEGNQIKLICDPKQNIKSIDINFDMKKGED